MQGLYLTMLTQVEGTENYLISETRVWTDRFFLNQLLERFPEVISEIKWAKKLRWDCICHTREEHYNDMREIGMDVDAIFEKYNIDIELIKK